MFLTLPVKSRTRSRDRRDPTNEAITVMESGICLNTPAMAMVTMARVILAPEEIPRTNGPAIGLRKKVWIRKPDSESAPPRRTPSRILGSLIFHITLYATRFASS